MSQARETTAGREDLPETLVVLRLVEGHHGLPEAVDSSAIVTPGLIVHPEKLVRPRLQDGLPVSRGERKGALGRSDGLAIRTHKVEMI